MKGEGSKKELEILLSQFQGFANPKVKLEQYRTDASIAADLLWNAKLNNHIKGKVIADLGCGPGIFGIGALILGARIVHFVDLDKEAIAVAKDNLKRAEKIMGGKFKAEFYNLNVKDFQKRGIHVVIQNPPFGVKKSHTDKIFLLKAMELAPVVYSFHKHSTKEFVEKVIEDNEYKVRSYYKYSFPIKKTFWFHFRSVENIEAGCWCAVKKK